MKLRKCDSCGHVKEGQINRISYKNSTKKSEATEYKQWDLCKDCEQDFHNWKEEMNLTNGDKY